MTEQTDTQPDLHEMPEVSSEDRVHVLDRDCWCEPEVIEVERRVVHREEPKE